eukprot:GFUD01098118.1.p1 GENE.GFUD01098118.1~~GFUD01098118.1.p1  ORF type:complete len:195 (+),score=54.28 GFUD01098118.1:171-755(+)
MESCCSNIMYCLVLLVVHLCQISSSPDYVYDKSSSRLMWQNTPATYDTEGSAYWPVKYGQDDEESSDGSGRHLPDFELQDSREDYTAIHKDMDEEIDTSIQVDIGFHDESTSEPTPKPYIIFLPSFNTVRPALPDNENQQTNICVQLAAVVGYIVVGLFCTILLVMFLLFRMRKADEDIFAPKEQKGQHKATST